MNVGTIKNIGTAQSGIDESVVDLFEKNTVTGEKAKATVGGNTYSSETRQVSGDDDYVYIVRKNRALLCVSCYSDKTRNTDRYWGAFAKDILKIVPKVN